MKKNIIILLLSVAFPLLSFAELKGTSPVRPGPETINGDLLVKGTIAAESGYVQTKYLKFTLPTPAILYGFDTQVCLIPNVPNAMTITKLEVTCDANPTTELTGDIKYADTFIGLANPVVINDFDTADGVRVDTSIMTGAVPAGKCVYLQWDTTPDAAMTQMSVIITYTVTE